MDGKGLNSSEKGLKISGLNGDSNPASAMPVQSSLVELQTIKELVIMWVDYKPVDAEMDNTRILVLTSSIRSTKTKFQIAVQKEKKGNR